MLKSLAVLLIIIALPLGLWFTLRSSPDFSLPSLLPVATREPEPDPERYRTLIDDLANERKKLAARYVASESSAEEEEIEDQARALLETRLPELMRCWLGTPWDFNGTSETPGEGKIACGYFVSTVLRDAGFEVERFRLAQQASQNIIGTFLDRDEMHITASTSYEKFLQQVIARGPGVRIVGLDSHVAFLIVNPDQSINFIHSSGARPGTVVDEKRSQAGVLAASNYRVTGNLTASQKVLQRWLSAAAWPTQT